MGEIYRWGVNSPHKGPVKWKMFPFDYFIMRRATGWRYPKKTKVEMRHQVCVHIAELNFNNFDPLHDDVTKWKHLPRYWSLVRGIRRSTATFPHKGQRRGALIFSLICSPINGWVNNREAGDLRRNRAHYDVNVMKFYGLCVNCQSIELNSLSPSEHIFVT